MSIKVLGSQIDRQSEILSDSALQLIEKLHNSLNPKRLELLKKRK